MANELNCPACGRLNWNNPQHAAKCGGSKMAMQPPRPAPNVPVLSTMSEPVTRISIATMTASEAHALANDMSSAMRTPTGVKDRRLVKAERSILEQRFGYQIAWSA